MRAKGEERETTVVQQVADGICARIRREKLTRGAPLPSYRELSRELGASYVSVKLGMDLLAAQGIVRQQTRQGCFVNKELSRPMRPLVNMGLITPFNRWNLFHDPYVVEIMQGLQDPSSAHGDLHVFSIREQSRLPDAEHLGKWDVDGVVILGVENDDYLRLFESWGTPGVAVDYTPTGVALDSVSCDNAAAARRMVEHLAALGHRRVAYVAPSWQSHVLDPRDQSLSLLNRVSSDARERQAESERALQPRGMLAAQLNLPAGEASWTSLVQEIRSLCRPGRDRVTAILTDSDIGAFRLVRELCAAGLRVPEDLSVCAVGGSRGHAAATQFCCTCCLFDFAGMGRAAVQRLAARCLRQPPAGPVAQRIGFAFAAGDTARRADASGEGTP